MRFRALIETEGVSEWRDFNLNLVPATLSSARTYCQAQVDEHNRRNKLAPKQTLLNVGLVKEPREKLVG